MGSDGKSKISIPDISDLLQIAQKRKTLVEKNFAKISERVGLINDTVHKPWVQFVVDNDIKRVVFPKGAADAQEYLNMSLSFTSRSLGIAFALGWEYAEHYVHQYKENLETILAAERIDSVAIIESTQNELKRLSEYGAFWMMRLDEMCLFAGYVDRATTLTELDKHKVQVQDVVFMAFKDGILKSYGELLGDEFDNPKTNLQKDKPELEPKSLNEMSELEKWQTVKKLLPAMEEEALRQLSEREAVMKETNAYVKKAIKERNRNIAIRNVFLVLVVLIVVALSCYF